MANRAQVIYDIERCICHVPDACKDCSYYKRGELINCIEELLIDAIELLKEQEERENAMCNKICEFIRDACSTDTDDDKDFVCYEIQRIFNQS